MPHTPDTHTKLDTAYNTVPSLSPNPYLCPSIKQLLETLNLFAVICSPLLKERKNEKSSLGEQSKMSPLIHISDTVPDSLE